MARLRRRPRVLPRLACASLSARAATPAPSAPPASVTPPLARARDLPLKPGGLAPREAEAVESQDRGWGVSGPADAPPAQRPASSGAARWAGVKLAFGTDNAREFAVMVDLGIAPGDAIVAAGLRDLGLGAARVHRRPRGRRRRTDIRVLERPARVVQGGRPVRSPAW